MDIRNRFHLFHKYLSYRFVFCILFKTISFCLWFKIVDKEHKGLFMYSLTTFVRLFLDYLPKEDQRNAVYSWRDRFQPPEHCELLLLKLYWWFENWRLFSADDPERESSAGVDLFRFIITYYRSYSSTRYCCVYGNYDLSRVMLNTGNFYNCFVMAERLLSLIESPYN